MKHFLHPGRTSKAFWTAARPAWQRHSHMARRQVSHFKCSRCNRALVSRASPTLPRRPEPPNRGILFWTISSRFSALALCRMFSRCSKHGPDRTTGAFFARSCADGPRNASRPTCANSQPEVLQVMVPTKSRAAGTDLEKGEEAESVLRTVTTDRVQSGPSGRGNFPSRKGGRIGTTKTVMTFSAPVEIPGVISRGGV